jgi:hypothetical protein
MKIKYVKLMMYWKKKYQFKEKFKNMCKNLFYLYIYNHFLLCKSIYNLVNLNLLLGQ